MNLKAAVRPIPQGNRNSHAAKRPAGSARKHVSTRLSNSLVYPSRWIHARVLAHMLSLSDGYAGDGFAARTASYMLSIRPHSARICEAAPAVLERMARIDGFSLAPEASRNGFTLAASPGGGTRKRDFERFAVPS